MSNVKNRMEELVERIKKWNHEYYNLDQPTASDAEFDKAFRELKDLEESNPEYVVEDTPTKKVGAEPEGKLDKIEHKKPMLSLGNSMDKEELREFDKRVRKGLGKDDIQYVAELKIDGLAMSLRYKDGKIEVGATRGNKFIGENITDNLKTLNDVPKKVSYTDEFEVRGEVYMNEDTFKELNTQREEEGKNLFANARNAAGGSIRMLDKGEVEKRKLNLFVYSVDFGENNSGYHSKDLEKVEELGFVVNPERKVCNGIEEVLEFVEKAEDKREGLSYGIDGVVVKVDSYEDQEELGFTSREPKWATAYKFKAVEEITTLKDIVLTMGRTGALTPNAVLEPVELDGTTVQRASLHNEDYIRNKDVRIGDRVVVRKSGDIIPEVVKPIVESREGKEEAFNFPEECPFCGEEVVRVEGEAVTKCVNVNCKEQMKERIIYFASKKAMDIDGLGDKVVHQVFDEGLIEKFTDLYRLKKEDLIKLERMGDKKADNLLKALEESKKNQADKVLIGLGIHLVGERASGQIMDKIKDIRGLDKVSEEELMEIDIVGPKMAESIVEFFGKEGNMQLIEELDSLGVNMVYEVEEKEEVEGSEDFEGKTFVITGTMEISGMKRGDVKKEVEARGGKVTGSVTGSTDVLIAGEKAGSKLKKAEDKGVAVWTEQDFLDKR